MTAETVDGAVQQGRRMLAPSRTAALDAQLLLAHVLGKDRTWVLCHSEAPVETRYHEAYVALLERRSAGIPVPHLCGRVSWYDMELAVSAATLVPRPETEVLVEEAIRIARTQLHPVIADVGTGCGAVALALARAVSTARIIASDVSSDALEVAERNIRRYRLTSQIDLLQSDLLGSYTVEPTLVVANLPYLSSEQMLTLDKNVRHEPLMALYGGEDGLVHYRALLAQLRTREWKAPVLFEIDPGQAREVRRMLTNHLPAARVEVIRDLSGRQRIATCTADVRS